MHVCCLRGTGSTFSWGKVQRPLRLELVVLLLLVLAGSQGSAPRPWRATAMHARAHRHLKDV